MAPHSCSPLAPPCPPLIPALPRVPHVGPQAAVATTHLATCHPPAPRTEVYGSRALDVCFDTGAGGMMGDDVGHVADLLGHTPEVGARYGTALHIVLKTEWRLEKCRGVL